MSRPKKPVFSVIWQGKNVTAELASNLLTLDYTDNVADESDELVISVEDVDGNWKGDWYPEKKDKIKLEFGYPNLMVSAGTFTVDEIELSGPPDVVRIRGLAAGVNSPIRTKVSAAHENITLRQIAETIAGKHGMKVVGEIENVRINRITQNRESDLAFLARLSAEYGYLFSVRENDLVFTSMEKLEKGDSIIEIDRTELMTWTFTDKTISTFQKTTVKHNDPFTGNTFAYTAAQEGTASPDTQEVRTRVENSRQAELKANAAQRAQNTQEITANFTVPGNPLLVAGNNIKITGLGKISGKFAILRSRHSITRSGGYTTTVEVKRTGTEARQTPKRTPPPQNTQVIYSK
jgi:phage protein D